MDTSAAMRALSAPHERGEKLPDIIDRCVRATGFKYSRCYEMYYGRAKRIEPEEIACISEALKRKQALEVRNELQELRLRLARLESILVLSDEEFHRDAIEVTRGVLRRSC